MRTLFLCLLAAATAFAMPADTNGAASCPGGYPEGAEIERGRLVYVCNGGKMTPKGCIAEDLTRVAVGANFDNGKYRRSCQLNGDSLSFEPTACLQNGQEHKPGDSWTDGTGSYTCKQNGDGTLESTPSGCVDSGKPVNPKDRVPSGEALMECQPGQNGKYELIPVGCVKDGKNLNFGDSVDAGDYYFNCTRAGRLGVALRAAGCISGGKRLNDGDRFNDGKVFKECNVDGNKTSTRTVACVQTDETGAVVERRLGCTWTEGAAPFQYEWACRQEADSAVKVQIRCNYNVGGGVYQIEAGCYRTVDKGVAGCIGQPGGMKLQLFEGDKADSAAQGAGLKAC